jgi:flotillin
MEILIPLAVMAVVAVLAVFMLIKNFLFVGRPNEVLIFSGRDTKMKDGSTVGYRLIRGGWAIKYPVVETVDRMDLRVFPVRIDTRGAYSKGGIPLNVHAIANVKVASDDGVIHNAIERFLGRSRDEIVRVAQETLEGNLRGVLATLTPEEINENRLRFSEQLAEDVEPDLEKLGLHLDTLKIQNVSDDRDYLDSLGRRRIAEILKVAEIAESDCMKQAEEVEAESQGRGEVARRNAQAQIQKEQNELRHVEADLELIAKSEEERAEARALTARAEAEQELQQVRTELEKLRLQADVVIPAEANKVARELIAAGEAAEIAEKGRAMAEVLRMTADAWKDAGENASDIFVLQRLDVIMKRVSEAAQQVTVREVALIDGGSGETLPNYVSSFPKIVASLFNEMRDTVGLDIGGALKGRTDGAESKQLASEQPAGLGALTSDKKESLARVLAQRKQDSETR